MNWVFDGIGTALVVFVLGFLAKAAVNRSRRVKQRQTAGDFSRQIQSGRDTRIGDDD